MFRVFLIYAIEDYSKVFHSHEPLAGERRNKLKGRISVTTPIAARIRNYSARLRRRQLGRSDEGLRPCRELMPIKLGNSSNIITVGSAQCVVAAALLARAGNRVLAMLRIPRGRITTFDFGDLRQSKLQK